MIKGYCYNTEGQCEEDHCRCTPIPAKRITRVKLGTRVRMNVENFLHRVYVINRRRQIELQRLDNLLPALPVKYPAFRDDRKHTPMKKKVVILLKEFLP